MRRGISRSDVSSELLMSTVREVLGERVRGIIMFGSCVYMGIGEDVDVLVVVDGELDLKRKLELEYQLLRELNRRFEDVPFDVHIMSMEELRENLVPGSFLSGLALGYEVVYDDAGLEGEVLRFLEALSREDYVLRNKYGQWDIGFHASILCKLRKGPKTSRGLSHHG